MMEIHSTRPACAYCNREGLIGELYRYDRNDFYMDFQAAWIATCAICGKQNHLDSGGKNVTVVEKQTKMEYGHTWD